MGSQSLHLLTLSMNLEALKPAMQLPKKWHEFLCFPGKYPLSLVSKFVEVQSIQTICVWATQDDPAQDSRN